MTADTSKLLRQSIPGRWPRYPVDTEYPCGCMVGLHPDHGAFVIRCDQHQTIPVRHANAARLAELCEALGEPLETPSDNPREPPYRMTWPRALACVRARSNAWRLLLEHMQIADPGWLDQWRSGLGTKSSDERP